MDPGILRVLASLPLESVSLPLDGYPFPFQMSVDFRLNAHKLVPVDVNFYPSGWNNLCAHHYPRAIQAFRHWIKDRRMKPKRILILAEHLDRNPNYVENLYVLRELLTATGAEVRVAILDERVPRTGVLWHGRSHTVEVEGIELGSSVMVTRSGFIPDWVVNENDFSLEPPSPLTSLSLPIDNPPQWGWYRRRKHWFFETYTRKIHELAHELSLDPWHFSLHSRRVFPVDFQSGEGIKELIEVVEELLNLLKSEYSERGIPLLPYVVIKDNQGTFGRGVIALRDLAKLKEQPRWVRQKMGVGKGARPIREVLVQEGIATSESWREKTAEFVGMTVGSEWVGGFFRTHREKGSEDPLNAPGMEFHPLCTEDTEAGEAERLRERVYGFMTRFVASVATWEIRHFLNAQSSHLGG